MKKYRDRDDYKALYDTLLDAENRGVTITAAKLAESTGYKIGSVGIYIRNKLRNVCLFKVGDKKYRVRGVKNQSYATFSYYMSQKSHDVEERDDSLFLSLRNRSSQAFYLALATFNNPTLRYRVEAFCILVSNAWELLLKARIIETVGQDQIERKDGKTISFLAAIEKVFPDAKNPIRRNLEKVNDLRDRAIHLLIPDIQNTLSRLFQSTILNYLKCLSDFKYPNTQTNQLPGLLSFVSSVDDLKEVSLIAKYGKSTFSQIADFIDSVEKEEKQLSSVEYAIPVEYKIVLTKDEKAGDLKLAINSAGEDVKLIEVPKDHNKTHPFTQSGFLLELKQRLKILELKDRVTAHTFQGILLVEKIRSTDLNQYYYKIENPTVHKYSEELLDLVLDKRQKNPRYLEKCYKARSDYLAKQREFKKRR